jgi:hypothetical protein
MHPLHLSVCNVDLSGTENIVSVKLFKDDFAIVLKNRYNADIPMERANEAANSEIISNYINACLQISAGENKPANLRFDNSEISEDAVWVHFKMEKLIGTGKLKIKNTLMLDLWEDETNLLILTAGGKDTGYRFNGDNTEIVIDRENQ